MLHLYRRTAACVALAFACGHASAQSSVDSSLELSAAAPITQLIGKRHAKGRVLIQPRAGLSYAQLDRMLSIHGGKRARRIAGVDVHVIELPEGIDERAVARLLSRHRILKFAELDIAVEIATTPNDPYYASAWHLPKIDAPSAWDFAKGSGVTIAVLDTGVDSAHPDLSTRMVSGWNFYDNNSNAADVQGHGTSVAGVSAASGNNGSGVTGVNWQARIMPLRVAGSDGMGYYSMMTDAIRWAADHGARVANLSFANVAGSSSIQTAAQYMRSRGGVVVVAAGNAGRDEGYAVNPSLTAVSATDSSDKRASFSSWGSYVDVAAPGVNVMTTKRGGGYGGFSGTSAASPLVAGVYGLMISANPTLTPDQLDYIMFSTAVDLGGAGWDSTYGNGRVNAGAAVKRAYEIANPPDATAPTAGISAPGSGATLKGIANIDATARDNIGVTRVELYLNGAKIASDNTTPYGFSIDTVDFADGNAALEARAVDAAGNVGVSQSVSVKIQNLDTVKPTGAITWPKADGALSTRRFSADAYVVVAAADNVAVQRVELWLQDVQVGTEYKTPYTFSFDTKRYQNGDTKLIAKIYDTAGNLTITAPLYVRLID